MLVRPARSSDAAALADVLNGVIAEGGLTAIDSPLSPEEFEEWFISGPHCRSCMVAIDRNGFQALERFHDDLPAGSADIATFVSASVRGKGTGRRLATATFREAERLGIRRLRAVVRSGNTGAIAYYRSLGFEGSMPPGGDAITLWRDLPRRASHDLGNSPVRD